MGFKIVDPSEVEIAESATPAQSEAAASAATPAPASTPAPKFKVMQAAEVQTYPNYANGLSETTPINQSPLSVEDRYKLALGNERGNLDYLKKRFEAVSKNEDGDLLVKDQGMWHRVDGKAFSDVDAWTATKGILKSVGSMALLTGASLTGSKKLEKAAINLADSNPTSREIMSEYAENMPTIAAVGASVLAGAATGGASLGVQAAGAGAAAAATTVGRTSLGRLEGTYSATPEEQAYDVGFETLLNMGGVGLAAGVKPTAAVIADTLPQWVKNMSKAPAAARDILKNTYGRMTVGADNIDELLENPDGVRRVMKWAGAKAGGNDGAFVQTIARDSISKVREAAGTGRTLLKELYGKMEDELVSAVPKTFNAEMDRVSMPALQDLMDNGLVAVKNGRSVYSTDQAMRIMNAGGGKLPKGFDFILRPQDELLDIFRRGGLDVGDGALVNETHAALNEFVGTVNNLRGGTAIRGERGVRALMRTSQVLDDLTYKLGEQGKDQAVNSMTRLMAGIHGKVRAGVTEQFEKAGAGSAFRQLNDSYASLKQPLNGLLAAAEKAARAGTDDALEAYSKRLAARPGTSEATKEGFEQVLSVAQKYGLSTAKTFGEIQKGLRANEAAKAFNPWIKPGLVGQGSAALAAGSLITGNPTVAMTLASAGAATSPRVAMGSTLAVNSMWTGLEQLNKWGSQRVSQLVSNPEALNAFVSATTQTPLVAEQVKSQLLSPLSARGAVK